MAVPTEEQLADRARFVLRGTVESRRAPHARDVPSTAATVRVDDVVQGPAKLMMFAGREVFVIPCPRERFRAGERAIFYTNALVFGDTLTLESVGHRPLAAGTIGARSTSHPAAALRTRDVQPADMQDDIVALLQRAPSTRGTTAPPRPARSARSVKTTGRKAGRRRRSPR